MGLCVEEEKGRSARMEGSEGRYSGVSHHNGWEVVEVELDCALSSPLVSMGISSVVSRDSPESACAMSMREGGEGANAAPCRAWSESGIARETSTASVEMVFATARREEGESEGLAGVEGDVEEASD